MNSLNITTHSTWNEFVRLSASFWKKNSIVAEYEFRMFWIDWLVLSVNQSRSQSQPLLQYLHISELTRQQQQSTIRCYRCGCRRGCYYIFNLYNELGIKLVSMHEWAYTKHIRKSTEHKKRTHSTIHTALRHTWTSFSQIRNTNG